ncbi:glutamine--fructose-6-phosphate transaminase (isomerizing) [Desulfohalovibrio reitneri]|uniref:glutamine--fructose-6-phosphate transaminase (isomerizing) n=1 Tax=Desulfohalovibrio reitneri TaxID=1307759 RepID=UPI0004A6C8BD|nr:glutamine--fructose-6-phosphate transaminase (isomerizing) [Desulfohalovibrio reitneri]
MCGIIAYSGPRQAVPVCLDGLSRLEYRGYDSAGVAYVSEGAMRVVKERGKVSVLREAVSGNGAHKSRAAVAHTRWATHGEPSRVNAHPHLDASGGLAMVHNGILENYLELKTEMEAEGIRFDSQTDSEVLVKLIGRELARGLSMNEALAAALERAEGSYAITLLDRGNPERLWAVRNKSPLVLGVGEDECFLASDVTAFLAHTREVVHLDDGEVVEVNGGSWNVTRAPGRAGRRKLVELVDWDVQAARKDGHPHFMLKEILEQPKVIRDCLTGRVTADGALRLDEVEARPVPSKLTILACGTSYYAGLWGKYVIERLAKVPVEVHVASEFRYEEPVLGPGDHVLVISQSGETADTLGGLELARERGAELLGLCNVVGSSIARGVDTVLYTQAGPEISVASTKAMCSQMLMLLLMAVSHGRRNGSLAEEAERELLDGLLGLADSVEESLDTIRVQARRLAREYAHASHFLFLGRGIFFPLAMEGALKLKEISYIHAEGYPSGEMKHGPIALIDRDFPTLALAQRDRLYAKVKSNLAEVRARGGPVIALTNPGHDLDVERAWEIPSLPEPLNTFMVLPALQLFAYEAAVALGRDVDQPRNLAKSVTVE